VIIRAPLVHWIIIDESRLIISGGEGLGMVAEKMAQRPKSLHYTMNIYGVEKMAAFCSKKNPEIIESSCKQHKC
jgi:hypothetical protein